MAHSTTGSGQSGLSFRGEVWSLPISTFVVSAISWQEAAPGSELAHAPSEILNFETWRFTKAASGDGKTIGGKDLPCRDEGRVGAYVPRSLLPYGSRYPYSIWVVVKIMVPFCVLNIIRHPIFRVPN